MKLATSKMLKILPGATPNTVQKLLKLIEFFQSELSQLGTDVHMTTDVLHSALKTASDQSSGNKVAEAPKILTDLPPNVESKLLNINDLTTIDIPHGQALYIAVDPYIVKNVCTIRDVLIANGVFPDLTSIQVFYLLNPTLRRGSTYDIGTRITTPKVEGGPDLVAAIGKGYLVSLRDSASFIPNLIQWEQFTLKTLDVASSDPSFRVFDSPVTKAQYQNCINLALDHYDSRNYSGTHLFQTYEFIYVPFAACC